MLSRAPWTAAVLLASLLFLLRGLSPGAALAAGEREDRHDPRHLLALLQIAKVELAERSEQCLPPGVGGGDLRVEEDSERAFAGIAQLFVTFLTSFPYTPVSEQERTEHVHEAALAYERAFECAPGWEKRHYIDQATALLEARIASLAADPRPEAPAERERLAGARQRLLGRLLPLHPPPQPAEQPEPPPPPPPCPQPIPGRGDWAPRLSLRLELGAGSVRLQLPSGGKGDALALNVGVAGGVRLLTRPSRHQRVHAGLSYGQFLFRPDPNGGLHTLHVLQVRLEYGLHLARWLSAQIAFEPGLEVHPTREVFGRGILGGSAGLCTLGELLCARIRGHIAPNEVSFANALVGLLSFDLVRLIDDTTRRRRRRAGS